MHKYARKHTHAVREYLAQSTAQLSANCWKHFDTHISFFLFGLIWDLCIVVGKWRNKRGARSEKRELHHIGCARTICVEREKGLENELCHFLVESGDYPLGGNLKLKTPNVMTWSLRVLFCPAAASSCPFFLCMCVCLPPLSKRQDDFGTSYSGHRVHPIRRLDHLPPCWQLGGNRLHRLVIPSWLSIGKFSCLFSVNFL